MYRCWLVLLTMIRPRLISQSSHAYFMWWCPFLLWTVKSSWDSIYSARVKLVPYYAISVLVWNWQPRMVLHWSLVGEPIPSPITSLYFSDGCKVYMDNEREYRSWKRSQTWRKLFISTTMGHKHNGSPQVLCAKWDTSRTEKTTIQGILYLIKDVDKKINVSD